MVSPAVISPPAITTAITPGNASAFDDIDWAWEKGIAELERQNLDLRRIPLFLILGSAGAEAERTLFEASGLRFTIADTPPGDVALRWYASSKAIFVVASKVGCLSKLAELGVTANNADKVAPLKEEKGQDLRRTLVVQSSESESSSSRRSIANLRGSVATQEDEGRSSRLGGLSSRQGGIRGTLMNFVRETFLGRSESVSVELMASLELTRRDIELQAARLKHLCKLFRRSRRPLCPVNGVLAVIPYGVVQRLPVGEGVNSRGDALTTAVRQDLEAAVPTFQLRFPVTALVTGLELESGFRDLAQRLGRDAAKLNRFGKGFHLWARPTNEQLEALGKHACGQFQYWIYKIFEKKESLDPSGNARNMSLYSLLCRVRRDVHPRLDFVLSDGFGYDPVHEPNRVPILFSGCYFAATGESSKEQAFVAAVFEKLIAEDAELEWTPDAIRQNRGSKSLARLTWGFNLVLAIAVAAIVYLSQWKK